MVIDPNTDALFQRVAQAHQHSIVVGLEQTLGLTADKLPGFNLRVALRSVAATADGMYQAGVGCTLAWSVGPP